MSAAKPTSAAGLYIIELSALLPQVLGSIFNIWYNQAVVLPLLSSDALKQRFIVTCVIYNLAAYPVAGYVWHRVVHSLRPTYHRLRRGEQIAETRLLASRRRVIHLPWIGALDSFLAWSGCIPVFLIALSTVGEPIDPLLYWHLPISFLVSAVIAVTHTIFMIELASHRHLFPVFFADARADRTPGAHSLSLRGRGVLWAISAGICPIGSLLLLSFAPPAPHTDPRWFAVFVGAVGIGFGLWTAFMLAKLVAQPVDQLRAAAQAVAQGNLDVSVPVRRADEFGVLAGEFNRMLAELRDKEKLRQTFGLHVGRRAAEQILTRDPGLSGVEQKITVMFVDIRAFTQRSAGCAPAEIVRVLNEFLRVMVHVVEERHGGMINKYLGDGFIALFGIGGADEPHADLAVAAGRDMLAALPGLNAGLAAEGQAPIEIGIGIHTGPAIVGSIGSPQRLEFTAIGATVNLASRIQGLTKTLGAPLLLTEATRAQLQSDGALEKFPAQAVRGLEEGVVVYGANDSHRP